MNLQHESDCSGTTSCTSTQLSPGDTVSSLTVRLLRVMKSGEMAVDYDYTLFSGYRTPKERLREEEARRLELARKQSNQALTEHTPASSGFVVAADLEKGKRIKLYAQDNTSDVVSVKDFLHLSLPYQWTRLIIEDAHMRPRPESNASKSQAFTRSELTEIFQRARDSEREIFLFFEKQTPKALRELAIELGMEEGEITKAYDAEAILKYHLKHPKMILKPFTASFCSDTEVEWLNHHMEDANSALNDLRAMDYPEDDKLVAFALDVVRRSYKDFSLPQQLYFDVSIVRGCLSTAKSGFVNKKRLLSTLLLLVDSDGQRRLNPSGDPLGFKGARRLFRMHPGKRGGVLRSNLMLRNDNWMVNRGLEKGQDRRAIYDMYKMFRNELHDNSIFQ